MNKSSAHPRGDQAYRRDVKEPENTVQAGRMTGSCQAMRSLIEQLQCYAPSELPILIQGETGSGKELCAEAIHQLSHAQKNSWVAVNCAAIPPGLLLAELFGCESGAFTNAHKRRGLILSAHRGTLFLDEVGELSHEAQAALLRVLEVGEFRALGSDQVRRVKLRLICATHRDLSHLVDQGKFRADLYHRISAVTLHVPPLRSRLSELPLIVTQLSLSVAMRLSREAWALICAYPWPGNVRELKNMVSRLEIKKPQGVISAEHLDLPKIRIKEGAQIEHSSRPAQTSAAPHPLISTPYGSPHRRRRDRSGLTGSIEGAEGDEKIFEPRPDKFLISGPPAAPSSPPRPEPPSTPPASTEMEVEDQTEIEINYKSFEGLCPLHNLELLFTVMPTMSLEALKQAYIEHLLRRFNGNISKVARALEISRNQVYRRQKSRARPRGVNQRPEAQKTERAWRHEVSRCGGHHTPKQGRPRRGEREEIQRSA